MSLSQCRENGFKWTIPQPCVVHWNVQLQSKIFGFYSLELAVHFPLHQRNWFIHQLEVNLFVFLVPRNVCLSFLLLLPTFRNLLRVWGLLWRIWTDVVDSESGMMTSNKSSVELPWYQVHPCDFYSTTGKWFFFSLIQVCFLKELSVFMFSCWMRKGIFWLHHFSIRKECFDKTQFSKLKF